MKKWFVIILFIILALGGFWYLRKHQSLKVNIVKIKDYPKESSLLNSNKGNTPKMPSIIFILLDAARADHFSCYGYQRDTTPSIDAISKKGVIFLNNYSQGFSTKESLAKIMTSRYYSYKGLASNREEEWWYRFVTNPENSIFLPELLEENGYLNVAFSAHPWLTEDSEFIKKFHWLYEFRSEDKPYAKANEITPYILSWLEKNKGKQFFLYIHFLDTHFPHDVSPPYDKFIDKNYNPKIKFERGDVKKHWEPLTNFTKDDLEYLKAIYDCDLNFVDHYVGSLYKKLEEIGIGDSTLFIITADHGDLLGEYGRHCHHNPEFFAVDELTHVPLIMVFPEKIPSGLRIDSITESIDIMPTVMDLAKLKLPEAKTVDGKSLASFFLHKYKGEDEKSEALMLAARSWGFAKAIRTEDFKFVMDGGNKYLYNVKNRAEQINIINSNMALAKNFEERIDEKFGKEESEWKDFIKNLEPNLTFKERISGGINNTSLSGSGWRIKGNDIEYIPDGTDAKPLNVKFEVPNGTYRIYLRGKFGKRKLFSSSNSLFKSRIENDKNYKFYNFNDLIKKKLIFLGKYKISDGFFDMSIDDLKDSPPGFRLKGFIFEPIKGIKEHEDKERTQKLKALGYLN